MSFCPARACPDRAPLWCSNGPRDENDVSGFVGGAGGGGGVQKVTRKGGG